LPTSHSKVIQPASDDAVPHIDPKYACFRMHADPSAIHRWGVYADEDIPARRKVIEYTGERLNRRQTKIRAARAPYCVFTIDSYWAVDGAVGGSGAEFINHSCDPNLESRIVKGHILYFSKRPIVSGEELTVDYRFGAHEERVECRCGARSCRGTINLPKYDGETANRQA
jgi:SET domain-containing protein